MNLTDKINSAEKGCKALLESYFLANYPVDKLISHGIDHHRRVWDYAKELLQYIENNQHTSDQLLVQKLLIACYLHDIGMSVDTGIKHGCHSRDICLRFIREHHLKEADYLDVLSAIENHDNKEYGKSAGENELQTILSVADDLDAFGYIGIYRYLEIYILRGIEPAITGNLILENAGKRFKNFLKIFGNIPELVNKYQKRYTILQDFFVNFNRQVSIYKFNMTTISGYCGVMEIIYKIIKEQNARKVFSDYQKEFSSDIIINNFFTKICNPETD